MRLLVGIIVALAFPVVAGAQSLPVPLPVSLPDPYCLGSYNGAAPSAGAPLRFGIDPGIAGSAGGAQLPSVPDNPTLDLNAVKALRPPGHQLVVRLNRLFWSDGQAGINAFKAEVGRYAAAGFEVELQVRYHPPQGEAGNIGAWVGYVRHVVDTFGPNPRVVSLTITNEDNVTFSPNTSDGYYTGAQDALIAGVEAGHTEAVHRHFRQLRFGFTYAYRFSPTGDAGFFSYLGSHGGPGFRAALGFVGVDFYPGSVYPPALPPGDSYRSELAQAAGVVRDCYLTKAGIGPATPIWLTENGVPTGTNSEAAQADALRQLVQAARDYSGTFGITDYRWFNLRDSETGSPAGLIGPTFNSDGLLRSNYTRKPSFCAYRSEITRLGHAALRFRRPLRGHCESRRGRNIAGRGRSSPVRKRPARAEAPGPALPGSARPSEPQCPSPTASW